MSEYKGLNNGKQEIEDNKGITPEKYLITLCLRSIYNVQFKLATGTKLRDADKVEFDEMLEKYLEIKFNYNFRIEDPASYNNIIHEILQKVREAKPEIEKFISDKEYTRV